MKSFFSTAPHNSGIALLMTLWVLVMLSVIAMTFSFSTRWGSASTRNFKEETKAYYLAMSGYQEAVGYLLSDKDNMVDYIDADGNLYIDKDTKPVTGSRVTDEAELEIKITDEGSKVNINFADGTRLKKVLDYVGIPPDSQQEIVDSILDWRDPDKDHHLSGAEDDYYESLDPPYKAKNRNLDSVEELLLVKGFKPEYLYGSKDIRPMYDLITTSGDGSININAVSREVLEMTGTGSDVIDAIFKQRTKEFGGARQIPANLAPGLYRTASYDFRIEVTAAMKGNRQAVKIISIVRRVPALKGFDMQTVYWREKIENRRG
ncbi:MAG: type II secretion system protein GspK, partial [Thermodesulfovibrionales bacterium]|nr:type II secretion system protein GspK [Thermodesulfovibrionales bacterium]